MRVSLIKTNISKPEWETTTTITIYRMGTDPAFMHFKSFCEITGLDETQGHAQFAKYIHRKLPGCRQFRWLILVKDISAILQQLGWPVERIQNAAKQLTRPFNLSGPVENLRQTIHTTFVEDILPLMRLELFKETPEYAAMITAAEQHARNDARQAIEADVRAELRNQLFPDMVEQVKREAFEFVKRKFMGRDQTPPKKLRESE